MRGRRFCTLRPASGGLVGSSRACPCAMARRLRYGLRSGSDIRDPPSSRNVMNPLNVDARNVHSLRVHAAHRADTQPAAVRHVWQPARTSGRLGLLAIALSAAVSVNAQQPPAPTAPGAVPAPIGAPRGPALEGRALQSVSGSVRSVTKAPAGEADGFVLDNATLIHYPPHLASQVAGVVTPGSRVRVDGRTMTRPEGDRVLEASRITNLGNNQTVLIAQGPADAPPPPIAPAPPVGAGIAPPPPGMAPPPSARVRPLLPPSPDATAPGRANGAVPPTPDGAPPTPVNGIATPPSPPAPDAPPPTPPANR